MENAIDFETVVENYRKSYEECLNCHFQKAYDLIKGFVEIYEVPFYPIICLNLEQYGYYKHLDKQKLISIENNPYKIIDDDFMKVCENAKLVCNVAYDFYMKMTLKGIFCEKDPDELVNLAELQTNVNSANYFAASKSWGLARKYIINSLMIVSNDISIWVSFAKTFLEESIDEHAFEGYLALLYAIELEKESFDGAPWDTYDFELHYTLLKFIVLFRRYGLEKPLAIQNELKILESCKKTTREELWLEQIKKDIKESEMNSKFCNNLSCDTTLKENANRLKKEPSYEKNIIVKKAEENLEQEYRDKRNKLFWSILVALGIIGMFILMYATDGFGASDWTPY